MSDEQTAQVDVQDWFLEHLVSLANEMGVEMGITLQAGGGFVSGTLVSRQAYFDGLATVTEKAFKERGAKVNAFALIAEAVAQHERTKSESSEPVAIPVGYIHL